MGKTFVFLAALLALGLLGVAVAAQGANGGGDNPSASPEGQVVIAPAPVLTSAEAPVVSDARVTVARDRWVRAANRAAVAAERYKDVLSGKVRGALVRSIARDYVTTYLDQLSAFAERMKAENMSVSEADALLQAITDGRRNLLNATTKQEARAELAAILEKWKAFRATALRKLHSTQIDAIQGTWVSMLRMNYRIQVALAHIRARGMDVSAVESNLSTCRAALEEAKPQLQQARDLLAAMGAEDKNETLAQVKDLVSQAKDSAKGALACYKGVLAQLREKAREAVGKPLVEPVVTPTPEPESGETLPAPEATASATPEATEVPNATA